MIYQFKEGSERKIKYDKLYHELFGQFQNKEKRIDWQEDKVICSCETVMTIIMIGHDIHFKCHRCDLRTMTPNYGDKYLSNDDENLKNEYDAKHKNLRELFDSLLTPEEKKQNDKENEEWKKMWKPVTVGKRELKMDWSCFKDIEIPKPDDLLYFAEPIHKESK